MGGGDGGGDGLHLEQMEVEMPTTQVRLQLLTCESEDCPRILKVAFEVFGLTLRSWLRMEAVNRE